MSYIRSVHRLLVALLACSAPASPPPANVAVPAPAKPASIAVQLARLRGAGRVVAAGRNPAAVTQLVGRIRAHARPLATGTASIDEG